MMERRVLFTPPWKLSNGDREWLRRNPTVADRYQSRWGVTLF